MKYLIYWSHIGYLIYIRRLCRYDVAVDVNFGVAVDYRLGSMIVAEYK